MKFQCTKDVLGKKKISTNNSENWMRRCSPILENWEISTTLRFKKKESTFLLEYLPSTISQLQVCWKERKF